jgi:hypothetical protein
MIHIATVHWESDAWIDIQLRYLKQHIEQPYRVYASLDRIEKDHSDRLYFSCSMERVNHPVKLNRLAKRIAEEADEHDLLMFLDGDAFPIAPLDRPLGEMLAKRPLAAVRRAENPDAFTPHPCFCVSTVGFWQEIGGDWTRGPTWVGPDGSVNRDAGVKLQVALEERGVEWLPILRTNVKDLHPVLFGVYGDLIYHHGAGFRWALTRHDIDETPGASELAEAKADTPERRELIKLTEPRRAENERLSKLVFDRIRTDDDFARHLFGA